MWQIPELFFAKCTYVNIFTISSIDVYYHKIAKQAGIYIKVEIFWKDNMDSIPSPSIKIQIMGGKVQSRLRQWDWIRPISNPGYFLKFLSTLKDEYHRVCLRLDFQ